MQRLLTPRDVADALQVSDAWVRKHAHELDGIRVGKHWRFHPSLLDRYGLERGTMPGLCPDEPPASASANARKAVGGGASDGEKGASSARSAPTRRKVRQRSGRSNSASAFAKAFPEYANRF
jgi:excisionase family DNA binding protein